MLLGCDAIVQTARTRISSGLSPETWKGAAWSTEDCRTVLRLIASSPYGAVPVKELEAAIDSRFSVFGRRLWGRSGAAAKLQSMNESNLLLRRAYSPLARDIDKAAFGPDLEDVYTLPSAAHVLAARLKLNS